ncbi:MAG: type II toxin-antitoxin system prevent-host-death family antitoxin [Opitutaceae bacterium]|jgi:prevent-host-death family protein
MNSASLKRSRSVGAYEAKTKLGELLDQVESGREITITRRARDVARLVPAAQPSIDHSVFARIRALHSRLSLSNKDSIRDLINKGRRI